MDRRESLSRFLALYPGVRVVPEHAVKGFLREAGLPAPAGFYLPVDVPLPDYSRLSYPLVAKVSSSRISSKSDMGGVRLGLQDFAGVAAAVAELMGIENAEGVILEEQAPPGTEVIVGGIIDPQFGPVVMFGLGGVFVEVYRDVAFAPAPMTRDDAFRLMERVKGYRLLTGYRGSLPRDREALADIMVIVSQLMATGLLEEIDLNPVALYASGAMILDAKMFTVSG
jgi:acetyl-CoA synthetase (ADP-forming)